LGEESDQEILIDAYGSSEEKSRAYYLNIYVKDGQEGLAEDVILASVDLSLAFNAVHGKKLFSGTDTLENFSLNRTADLDLFRSESLDSGSGSWLRFAQGSASQLATGKGVAITNEETFLAQVKLDVDDAAFAGADIVSADISDYLTLSVNVDETILVDGSNKIQSLREFGASVDGFYSVVDTSTTVKSIAGEFSISAENALSGFGTELQTSNPGVFTNMLRSGQTVYGSFDIANIGDASLNDLRLDLSGLGGQNYQDTTVSPFIFTKTEGLTGNAVDITGNVDLVGEFVDLKADLTVYRDGSGTISQLNDEAIRVSYAFTAGEAGNVAEINGLNTVEISADGAGPIKVFAGLDTDSVKNLITYQGDLNYDGNVGMRDLAVLNEGARLAGPGGSANLDADADFSGTIDIADLAVLSADWGKSLWTDGDPDPTFAGQGTDPEDTFGLAEMKKQGSLTWTNPAFETAEANVQEAGFELAMVGTASGYTAPLD
jgi:hypothetical protein